MNIDQRARAIAAQIQQARPAARNGDVRVTSHSVGSPLHGERCTLCGYRFTGDTYIVERSARGRRAISERSVHYLAHGLATHETGDIMDGEPVRVEIDLASWERFLSLDEQAPPESPAV
jgi:hypothetical protein